MYVFFLPIIVKYARGKAVYIGVLTRMFLRRYSYFISFLLVIGVHSHGLLRENLTDFKLSINNNN